MPLSLISTLRAKWRARRALYEAEVAESIASKLEVCRMLDRHIERAEGSGKPNKLASYVVVGGCCR